MGWIVERFFSRLWRELNGDVKYLAVLGFSRVFSFGFFKNVIVFFGF